MHGRDRPEALARLHRAAWRVPDHRRCRHGRSRSFTALLDAPRGAVGPTTRSTGSRAGLPKPSAELPRTAPPIDPGLLPRTPQHPTSACRPAARCSTSGRGSLDLYRLRGSCSFHRHFPGLAPLRLAFHGALRCSAPRAVPAPGHQELMIRAYCGPRQSFRCRQTRPVSPPTYLLRIESAAPRGVFRSTPFPYFPAQPARRFAQGDFEVNANRRIFAGVVARLRRHGRNRIKTPISSDTYMALACMG